MVYVEVHSECLQLKYKAAFCSKTTFFMVVMTGATIILPFFITYHSKGFWLKRDRFHERPDIRYRYEYLLAAETDRMDKPILCSNLVYADQKYTKCPEIQVYEADVDNDGLFDHMNVNISILTPSPSKLTAMTLLLMFDYRIKNVCPIKMQSAVVLQHAFSFPVARITFMGDVTFHQVSSVPCERLRTFTDYNQQVVKAGDDYQLERILSNYHSRNVTTRLDNIVVTWTTGTSPETKLSLRLRYPEHVIYYTPKFWQVIKNAWIQYFAVYVIIFWLATHIRNYVLQNKLLLYRTEQIKQL